jgi:hypothetical protein
MHQLLMPARLKTSTKGDWPALPVFLQGHKWDQYSFKVDMTNLKSAGSSEGMSIPTIKPVSTWAGFNEKKTRSAHGTHIADEDTKKDSAHGSNHVLPWITGFRGSANR